MTTATETAQQAPTGIVFTDAAASKVSELIAEEANPNLKLRVFISGGGCSGFQYGLNIEDAQKFDAAWDDANGMIIVSLKNVQRRRGRRPKNA